MNATEDITKLAKAVIREEVERAGCAVKRILLFGSRAKDEAGSDSDWDFYVVVENEIPTRQQEKIASQICWRLARQGVFSDVFVQSEKVVAARKTNTGYLTYYALKDGLEL